MKVVIETNGVRLTLETNKEPISEVFVGGEWEIVEDASDNAKLLIAKHGKEFVDDQFFLEKI